MDIRFKLDALSPEGCVALLVALLTAFSGLLVGLRKWWPGAAAKRRERAELEELEAKARRVALEVHHAAMEALKRKADGNGDDDEPQRLGPRRIERK